MKLKISWYTLVYYLVLPALIYVECHCLRPVKNSGLETLREINWSYVAFVIGVALAISLFSIDPIHRLFKFLKPSEETRPTYTFIAVMFIFSVLIFRNLLIALTDQQFQSVISFITFPLFGTFWAIASKMFLVENDDSKNHEESEKHPS